MLKLVLKSFYVFDDEQIHIIVKVSILRNNKLVPKNMAMAQEFLQSDFHRQQLQSLLENSLENSHIISFTF